MWNSTCKCTLTDTSNILTAGVRITEAAHMTWAAWIGGSPKQWRTAARCASSARVFNHARKNCTVYCGRDESSDNETRYSDTFTLRWYRSTPSTGPLAHSLFQTIKLVSLVTAVYGYCSSWFPGCREVLLVRYNSILKNADFITKFYMCMIT